MFGTKLAAPKTALEQAKAAATKAKEAALAKANKVALAVAAATEDYSSKLHRKMTSKEKKELRVKRKGLGREAEKLNTPK